MIALRHFFRLGRAVLKVSSILTGLRVAVAASGRVLGFTV